MLQIRVDTHKEDRDQLNEARDRHEGFKLRAFESTSKREVLLVDKWQNYYFNGFLLSKLLVIAAVSFLGYFAVLCYVGYWLLLHGTVDSNDVVQQYLYYIIVLNNI